MEEFYKEDLVYIHDIDFSDWAIKSAPGILEIFDRNKITEGLIVDLGCGSGLSAIELVKAGYRVLGIDISESILDLARIRVPNAEFKLGSVFKAEIPACNAVIAIGECFNYLFERDNNNLKLVKLFERIYYKASIPGGVFIFDIVEPGQVKAGEISQGFREGKDWIVLVEKEEDRKQNILTRRIIILRKIEEYYRRDEEIHRQQLYQRTDIAKLKEVGFEVEILDSYGDYKLPIAGVAFIATKSK